MKPEHQTPMRTGEQMNRARVHGPVREQLRLLVLPSIVALIAGWRALALLGDLLLSVVLGCVAFLTMTPLLASMSDRDFKRRGENK